MNGQTSCATLSRTGIAAMMESAQAAPDRSAVRGGGAIVDVEPLLAQPATKIASMETVRLRIVMIARDMRGALTS